MKRRSNKPEGFSYMEPLTSDEAKNVEMQPMLSGDDATQTGGGEEHIDVNNSMLNMTDSAGNVRKIACIVTMDGQGNIIGIKQERHLSVESLLSRQLGGAPA